MTRAQQGSTERRDLYIGGILAVLLLAGASCALQMTHAESLRVGAALFSIGLVILSFCVVRARISGLLVPQAGSLAALTYGVWNITFGATLLCIGGRIFDNAGNGFSVGSSIAGGLFLLFGGWIVVQGGCRFGELAQTTRQLAT